MYTCIQLLQIRVQMYSKSQKVACTYGHSDAYKHPTSRAFMLQNGKTALYYAIESRDSACVDTLTKRIDLAINNVTDYDVS